MSSLTQKDLNKLIDVYFESKNNMNNVMYRHLHESYDDMINYIVPECIQENVLYKTFSGNNIIEYNICVENIKVKLPCDEYDKHYITPQIARNRGLTYSCSVYGDIRVKKVTRNIKSDEKKEFVQSTNNVLISKIPSMVKSNYCTLTLFPDKQQEECDKDPGGYFIVNGNEKVVVSLEKQVYNKPLFISKSGTNIVSINSQKNYSKKSMQQFLIYVKKDIIMVSCNIFSSEIPLIILIRSMANISDKEIVQFIMKQINDSNTINIIHNTIHHSNNLVSKEVNTDFYNQSISYVFNKLTYTKSLNTEENELNTENSIIRKIFRMYLLPHMGDNIESKMKYILYMTNRLFYNSIYNSSIFSDKDSYENKRIDTPGILIGQLFKQAWNKILKDMSGFFIKKNSDDSNILHIINFLKPSYIEQFIKSSLLTGNWGISKNKKGVSRILDRLSYMKAMSDLRKVIIPSVDETTKKIISMRQVHPSQTGFICVVDTPEGEKVGIVKAMSIQTSITPMDTISAGILKEFILQFNNFIEFKNYSIFNNEKDTLVFIDGACIGCINISKTHDLYLELKKMKLTQKVSKYVSIILNIDENEISIYTDNGRFTRPLLRVKENLSLYIEKGLIEDPNISFDELMVKNPNVIEFVDVYECLFSIIAESYANLVENKHIKDLKASYNEMNKYYNSFNQYQYCELHPSMILGLCASTIPFCNYNQAPRNSYHVVQIKQAMCIYLTTHKKRIDITNLLHDPQKPLVAPMMNKHIHLDELPYGKNIILAIMPFSGYNQEDSMILNKSSVDRGMFMSVTYKGYFSEIQKNQSSSVDDIFLKPDKNITSNIKNEVNYDKLQETGVVSNETFIDTNDVLIGKVSPNINQVDNKTNNLYVDKSTVYKNMTPCRVEKNLHEINGDGYEMIKVKTRSFRKPVVGDKFTSRSGQKATCGILMDAQDMPFTKDGLVPDIIINSNAIPSRMTIGQLYEILISKVAAMEANFYDGTSFENIDINEIIKKLKNFGYNEYGTEDMYSGITGEKYKSQIFIGPCYYIRLKQQVSDKIHARSIGSTQIMTRQPPEGRTKNGGLRFGEMERDACIAHGASIFLNERMMDCSDKYSVRVCDLCGFFASKMKKSDRYWCKSCNNVLKISNIHIPYCFKLMIQELQSINIGLRLRTENYVESN
jgi:DNA-directed RNA polymerase II subunit RPB2